ncbi:response regulator [Mesorhizobium sp. WSM3866]|uniref:response regulator n=1 Tax=Mesorhizobium sp. WSM3866 TaxID=422271 RepID=UPI000BB048BB|nr:response regulator [Mesorhizobium sp. WSM3866]PBB42247.1 response regulator [Mesorhizobium sp. WSM3866]
MTELAAPHGRRRPIPTKAASAEPVAAALPTRILVVEDDFLISLEMESTLTAAGFEVVVVGSGEEALDSAAADRPDLVVMDIRLSGAMDGIQTALELFRIYGLRSVFATAHSDSDVRARAAPAEPLGWLVKPYTPASLLSAIRSALRPGSSSAG